MVCFFLVQLHFPHIPDDVCDQQKESEKGTILEHPDLGLQGNKKLKIFFLAVNVQAEKEQEQVEARENNIEDNPLVGHEGGFIP